MLCKLIYPKVFITTQGFQSLKVHEATKEVDCDDMLGASDLALAIQNKYCGLA